MAISGVAISIDDRRRDRFAEPASKTAVAASEARACCAWRAVASDGARVCASDEFEPIAGTPTRVGTASHHAKTSAAGSAAMVEIRCFLEYLSDIQSTRATSGRRARAASSIGGRTCCDPRRRCRCGSSFHSVREAQ